MPAQDRLDLPYEERLAIYQENTSAAQTEILRSKLVYEEEKASGASQERLNQINNWANQVRAAAGIDESNTLYGNNPAVSPAVQDALTRNYYEPDYGNGNAGGGGGGGGYVPPNPFPVIPGGGGGGGSRPPTVPIAGQIGDAIGKIGNMPSGDLMSVGIIAFVALLLFKD